ncbi:hypothetical protein CAP35_11825 [Chitinophagaceae bacterium IBVUCB1]|nr:hypothetical protein CAP35_11825 [Chitinophagaceae bacterium IBVUCB1]
MRRLYSFLLVFFAVLSVAMLPTKQAKASHAAGGEIIYEWIADSTYRVFFKFYRDCTGIAEPTSEILCITDSCNSFQSTVTMNKWTGTLPGGGTNGDPVSAGCSAFPNKCQNLSSPLPGYREWWYSAIIQLPSRCVKWRFSIGISARNTSLNIGGGNLYIETTFNNRDFQGNSSPYFSIKPIPYVCVNTPYSYNNGAIDPNGDSLVTDVVNPLQAGSCGPGTIIPFNAATPALSIPGNPFQTNNTFAVNSATGQMTFTAATVGAHTLSTRVREYRAGGLIGYIMRDVQVQVLSCSTTPSVLTVNPASIVGGAQGLGGRIEGCVGQNLAFNFAMTSTDTGAILTAEDNSFFSIPTATINYSNLKTDSVVGTFSWTPAVVDGGKLKNLIVTIKDSTCRPPGIMLYYPITIPIYIWGPTVTVPDTSICPNETAYLNASGGGNYVWSVLPGGSPITSLSCTNCPSPVASPGMLTRYLVTSTINPFCPNINKDTVTVTVLQGVTFTPMADILTCPRNAVNLNLNLIPSPGVIYKTKWSPATFLNNDTLNTPTSTPGSTVTYRVVISSNINVCKAFDTVRVDVLTGFVLNNQDTAVCEGATITPNITGDSRYTYLWSAANGNGQFSDPNIINPVITPAPLGPNKYIIKASFPGCSYDSLAEFDVDVEPNPFVVVNDDASMCENDTMKLQGIITPSNFNFDLEWTPGASLDNNKSASPIFKAQQTTKLTLTAKSPKAGCSAFDTVLLTVFPADFLVVDGDTAICPGNEAKLSVTGTGLRTFKWHPEVRISSTQSANPTVSPMSTQLYKVFATDVNECFDTAEVKVVVHPGARIFLPDSVRIYPGETYQMDPTGNCSYFAWFPPLGLNKADISNPIVKPDVNTRYIVTGVTESGCSTTDSISVLVSAESMLEVPNAFSPGSANGTFKILRRGDATLKSFTIYNRWGMKVFETSDINKGWDGTFNGEPQPLGVYIYTVDAVTSAGRRFTKQGNVTLVR